MPIYLHPIDEKPDLIEEHGWVEIDLVNWASSQKDYPYGITLVRKLSDDTRQPYLQELMFESLHLNKPIKQITLEIPNGIDSQEINTYHFRDIQILNYAIHPKHSHQQKAYEKLSFLAKEQRVITTDA